MLALCSGCGYEPTDSEFLAFSFVIEVVSLQSSVVDVSALEPQVGRELAPLSQRIDSCSV